MEETRHTLPSEPIGNPVLQAQDVVAGLGAAPRNLLATCLALFEDSTLQQRLVQHAGKLSSMLQDDKSAGGAEAAVVSSLQQRIDQWMQDPQPDAALRVMVWMHLRDAFGLPANTFGCLRSARTAADDLVASTLASIRLSMSDRVRQWLGRGEATVPASLDVLARQTLKELMDHAQKSYAAASAEEQQESLRELKRHVTQLDEASKQSLLKAIGASEFNDDAIRTIFLTGGGLASFGGAVSLSGFSAYILAAKVSAIIPMVSGPMLVSVVSVMSNPLTIILLTAGMGWWATRAANQKIQAAIAMRVVSLLALTGIASGDGGLRQMASAFVSLPEMKVAGTLSKSILAEYRKDWGRLAPAHRQAFALGPFTAKAMARTLPSATKTDRWEHFLRSAGGAKLDMAAMSALTIGELLYNIHALDPSVLKAADFARIENLNDPVMFAAFAQKIGELEGNSYMGVISNLKGYVAEQVVAVQLVEQGHVIEFPDSANQAGWDLAVDGVKFQVKNAADLQLLAQHFDKGYDYPILANAEVAELLAQASEAGRIPEWADQVHFVEGYSQASVQEVLDRTLEAGEGMLNPNIPAFGVMLASVRQFSRYSEGKVTATQALQEVLINGSLTAGLAVTGNFVGVTIGLLMFGPAGGLVLGSVLPILSRTQVGVARNAVEYIARSTLHDEWLDDVRRCLQQLIGVLEDRLKQKAEKLKVRAKQCGSDPVGRYLNWRLDEDVRFLREAWVKLAAIWREADKNVESAGERLLVWLSTCTLHPATYQAEMRQWLEMVRAKPGLGDNLYQRVGSAAGKARRAWAAASTFWVKSPEGKTEK